MADRRPDDLSPPPAPFRPVPGQASTAAHPSPFQGRVTEEHRPLTERINAAYASSAPIVPDEEEPEPQPEAAPEPSGRADGDTRDTGEIADGKHASEPRPSAAERFAAVLAATTGGSLEADPAPAPDAAAAAAPAKPAAKAKPASAPRRVRRARLRLTHVDPWSVMKTSFLLAVALGIVLVVAVAVVWTVLGAAGVWESINATVGDVLGETGSDFRVENYLGMSRVMGFTLVVAVVDVVLITVIATLGAFLYNLAAALLGGIEVVFSEEDR